MRKIWAIVRREFTERVRQRWFWVMALLGPLFFSAVFVLPILLGRVGVSQIVVVDGTTSRVGVRISELLDASPQFRAVRVPARPHVFDSLTAEVEARRLSGFLILTDAAVESGTAEYRGSNVSRFATLGARARPLAHAGGGGGRAREGVDPRIVARARIPVHLETKKIAGGKTTGETAAQSFSLAYFMGIILYTAILLYGINVMSSVLEEKTTRIVEVLVSSVRPFQLLLGKVLGVGAVSIFQFLIWAVSARLLLAARPRLLPGSGSGDVDQVFQMPHVSGATALIFITYFLGGFFLYSAMFAAVGAISSSEQEARQAQQPVAWLLVLSFICSTFALPADPGSAFAIALSLVPFSAPIAMPVRWAAGDLPVGEIVLSLVILVATMVPSAARG
jgi:ABC-2 type transport system permease protein